MNDRLILTRGHKAWLYGAYGLLTLSGVLWLVFHFFLRGKGEFGDAPHPWQPTALQVHGFAAMATLVMLGTLLPGHVRRGWRANKSLRTGVSLLAFNGILALTGYGLYYAGGEKLREWTSLVHWVLGLAAPVTMALHVWIGHRARRRPAPLIRH